jgi:hypothetical protein
MKRDPGLLLDLMQGLFYRLIVQNKVQRTIGNVFILPDGRWHEQDKETANNAHTTHGLRRE